MQKEKRPSVPRDGVKFKPVPTTEEKLTKSEDYLCGLGSWRPNLLQRLATPKSYLMIFCILGILQGAYFTYTIGVISTIEKRYAFESKVSGLILIADNLSPILTSTLVGYFSGQSHRPHWIAGGMSFVVFSCFLSAVPYYIYGPGTHLLSESTLIATNSSNNEFCDALDKETDCDARTTSSAMVPSVSILFIASFLNGFGYTAFYSIGTSYLDDNVKKKNSPLHFSMLFSLRMFGPSLGFLLSSFSLSFYEDPFYDPGITKNDPRWIGAWWMGFLILGVGLLIFTIPMLLFPKHLPRKSHRPPSRKNSLLQSGTAKDDQGKQEKVIILKLRDLLRGLKRLIRNPILVCHTLSSILHISGVAGYFMYMPRYIETQFRQSASTASLFSGSAWLIFAIAGIMVGGMLIHKFRPRPRYLTFYMVILEVALMGTLFTVMLYGCPPHDMAGTERVGGSLQLNNECNKDCGCTKRAFQPVCGPNGETTYFSPCYAGCQYKNFTSGAFEDCSCVHNETKEEFSFGSATSGFCPTDCSSFLPFIIILSIGSFVSSTGRVGNMLIPLRAVDPKDKSLTLGALGGIFALLAFIPYTLIYGALVDSCCLVWEKSCSKTGNCWLYDVDKFRYLLHGVTIGFCFLATIFDFMVFVFSGRFKNFYDDDDPEVTENGNGAAHAEEDDDMEEVGDFYLKPINPVLHTSVGSLNNVADL